MRDNNKGERDRKNGRERERARKKENERGESSRTMRLTHTSLLFVERLMTLELSCQAIILVVGQVWIGNQFLQMRVESHSCSPDNGPSPLTGLMGKLPLDKQKTFILQMLPTV